MDAEVPYIVAGPCSVESRPQLQAVVESLRQEPRVAIIRCGVWKPRTRPGGFEGRGEEALQWMADLRSSLTHADTPSSTPTPQSSSIPSHTLPYPRFCCEVALPEHVELALRYGIDAVWIGARTTANPFMVQELTEALRGTGLPVLVKNPPSPDVRLWIGTVERCLQTGLTDIKAVHRGFDLHLGDGYRNSPLWEIPIELRRLMPTLPILCDPSHIAGSRTPIAMLSQTALDLGFDGLMVEVHPNPAQALTDADQQLTPQQLTTLLDGLQVRHTNSPEVPDQELLRLRRQIDQLDSQLLHTLSQRMLLSAQIGQLKRRDNLTLFQPTRWADVLQSRREAASQLNLNPDFVKELFEKIHAESVRVQAMG